MCVYLINKLRGSEISVWIVQGLCVRTVHQRGRCQAGRDAFLTFWSSTKTKDLAFKFITMAEYFHQKLKYVEVLKRGENKVDTRQEGNDGKR